VSSFKELIVWQKSHAFALSVYKATSNFPPSEQFGLSSQVRRAVVSISSNIVEGYERGSQKEFNRFLLIARGSNAEVQAQLLLAKDLGYLKESEFLKLADQSIEINKLINGFRKGLARYLEPRKLYYGIRRNRFKKRCGI
jgi:four helix bundle protein